MSNYLEEKTLPELRDIATDLAIEYPKNIGRDKLIAKILADDETVEDKPAKIEGVEVKKAMTPSEIKKAMQVLKRVRISANDPQLKGRNGVSMKVGNKYGVVGKFIPFDTIWHIQDPIYAALMRRQWRETKFVTDRTTGAKVPKVTMRPAFSIEVLEPLTQKELNRLAIDQSARGAIPTEND